MHRAWIEFLPDSSMTEGYGQEGLDPGGSLIRAIFFFPEMPESIVPPPEGDGGDPDQTDKDDEKSQDDRQKNLHDVNFLSCPEASQRIHFSNPSPLLTFNSFHQGEMKCKRVLK